MIYKSYIVTDIPNFKKIKKKHKKKQEQEYNYSGKKGKCIAPFFKKILIIVKKIYMRRQVIEN